jgi:hypothetical protein
LVPKLNAAAFAGTETRETHASFGSDSPFGPLQV